jgi:hypothetical protein
MNKPQISKTDVKRVAATLIAAVGTTTSLEVKNQLRAEGFEAHQNNVSTFLQEVAAEESYKTDVKQQHGVSYNQYSAPVAVAAPPTTTVAPTSASADPGILDKVVNAIFNIFGYKADPNDKFDTGQVTSKDDMTDLLTELAPQFNLAIADFDSEFDPGAIIIWRDKTPNDLALFVGTLTNVNPPAAKPIAPNVKTVPVQSAAQNSLTKHRKKSTPANHTPLFVATPSTTLNDIRNGYDKKAWVVYSTKNTDKAIYDGGISRDQVRSAYAKKNGVLIQAVRSRRVGNIVPGTTYKHLG